MTSIVDRSSRRTKRSALARSFDNRTTLIVSLLAPVLIFFIVFNTIPTLWLLGLSFYNYSLTSGSPPQFVGFRNFLQLYNNRNSVWADLSRTFFFVALRRRHTNGARNLFSAFCFGDPRTCRGGALR